MFERRKVSPSKQLPLNQPLTFFFGRTERKNLPFLLMVTWHTHTRCCLRVTFKDFPSDVMQKRKHVLDGGERGEDPFIKARKRQVPTKQGYWTAKQMNFVIYILIVLLPQYNAVFACKLD